MCDVFSWLDWLWVLRRNHRDVLFSLNHIKWPIISVWMTTGDTLITWLRRCLPGFSPIKSLFLSFCTSSFGSEWVTKSSLHSKKTELQSWRGVYICCLEFFCRKKLASSLHLFLYSIFIYIYMVMDIYVILLGYTCILSRYILGKLFQL